MTSEPVTEVVMRLLRPFSELLADIHKARSGYVRRHQPSAHFVSESLQSYDAQDHYFEEAPATAI